ncbi:hypothetical protein ACF0H5_012059 [Mactra antiquata]
MTSNTTRELRKRKLPSEKEVNDIHQSNKTNPVVMQDDSSPQKIMDLSHVANVTGTSRKATSFKCTRNASKSKPIHDGPSSTSIADNESKDKKKKSRLCLKLSNDTSLMNKTVYVVKPGGIIQKVSTFNSLTKCDENKVKVLKGDKPKTNDISTPPVTCNKVNVSSVNSTVSTNVGDSHISTQHSNNKDMIPNQSSANNPVSKHSESNQLVNSGSKNTSVVNKIGAKKPLSSVLPLPTDVLNAVKTYGDNYKKNILFPKFVHNKPSGSDSVMSSCVPLKSAKPSIQVEKQKTIELKIWKPLLKPMDKKQLKAPVLLRAERKGITLHLSWRTDSCETSATCFIIMESKDGKTWSDCRKVKKEKHSVSFTYFLNNEKKDWYIGVASSDGQIRSQPAIFFLGSLGHPEFSSKELLNLLYESCMKDTTDTVDCVSPHADKSMVLSPYYKILSKIITCSPIPLFSGKGTQVIKYNFTIGETLSHVLFSSRSKGRAFEFDSQRFRVIVRINEIKLGGPMEDKIPLSIVYVNGKVSYIQREGKNGGSIDITDKCNFNEFTSSQNELSFEWLPDNQMYGLSIFVIDILDTEAIPPALLLNNVRPAHDTMEMIQNILKDDEESDIKYTSIKTHLTCPLSKSRLVIPCRGLYCTHVFCMDAVTLIKLNKSRSLNDKKCFMCDQPLEYMYVDGLFLEILECVPETIDEIEFQIDGSWSYAKPTVNDPKKDTNVLYEVDVQKEHPNKKKCNKGETSAKANKSSSSSPLEKVKVQLTKLSNLDAIPLQDKSLHDSRYNVTVDLTGIADNDDEVSGSNISIDDDNDDKSRVFDVQSKGNCGTSYTYKSDNVVLVPKEKNKPYIDVHKLLDHSVSEKKSLLHRKRVTKTGNTNEELSWKEVHLKVRLEDEISKLLEKSKESREHSDETTASGTKTKNDKPDTLKGGKNKFKTGKVIKSKKTKIVKGLGPKSAKTRKVPSKLSGRRSRITHSGCGDHSGKRTIETQDDKSGTDSSHENKQADKSSSDNIEMCNDSLTNHSQEKEDLNKISTKEKSQCPDRTVIAESRKGLRSSPRVKKTDKTNEITKKTDKTSEITLKTGETSEITKKTDKTSEITKKTDKTSEITKKTDKANDMTKKTGKATEITNEMTKKADKTEMTKKTDKTEMTKKSGKPNEMSDNNQSKMNKKVCDPVSSYKPNVTCGKDKNSGSLKPSETLLCEKKRNFHDRLVSSDCGDNMKLGENGNKKRRTDSSLEDKQTSHTPDAAKNNNSSSSAKKKIDINKKAITEKGPCGSSPGDKQICDTSSNKTEMYNDSSTDKVKGDENKACSKGKNPSKNINTKTCDNSSDETNLLDNSLTDKAIEDSSKTGLEGKGSCKDREVTKGLRSSSRIKKLNAMAESHQSKITRKGNVSDLNEQICADNVNIQNTVNIDQDNLSDHQHESDCIFHDECDAENAGNDSRRFINECSEAVTADIKDSPEVMQSEHLDIVGRETESVPLQENVNDISKHNIYEGNENMHTSLSSDDIKIEIDIDEVPEIVFNDVPQSLTEQRGKSHYTRTYRYEPFLKPSDSHGDIADKVNNTPSESFSTYTSDCSLSHMTSPLPSASICEPSSYESCCDKYSSSQKYKRKKCLSSLNNCNNESGLKPLIVDCTQNNSSHKYKRKKFLYNTNTSNDGSGLEPLIVDCFQNDDVVLFTETSNEKFNLLTDVKTELDCDEIDDEVNKSSNDCNVTLSPKKEIVSPSKQLDRVTTMITNDISLDHRLNSMLPSKQIDNEVIRSTHNVSLSPKKEVMSPSKQTIDISGRTSTIYNNVSLSHTTDKVSPFKQNRNIVTRYSTVSVNLGPRVEPMSLSKQSNGRVTRSTSDISVSLDPETEAVSQSVSGIDSEATVTDLQSTESSDLHPQNIDNSITQGLDTSKCSGKDNSRKNIQKSTKKGLTDSPQKVLGSRKKDVKVHDDNDDDIIELCTESDGNTNTDSTDKYRNSYIENPDGMILVSRGSVDCKNMNKKIVHMNPSDENITKETPKPQTGRVRLIEKSWLAPATKELMRLQELTCKGGRSTAYKSKPSEKFWTTPGHKMLSTKLQKVYTSRLWTPPPAPVEEETIPQLSSIESDHSASSKDNVSQHEIVIESLGIDLNDTGNKSVKSEKGELSHDSMVTRPVSEKKASEKKVSGFVYDLKGRRLSNNSMITSQVSSENVAGFVYDLKGTQKQVTDNSEIKVEKTVTRGSSKISGTTKRTARKSSERFYQFLNDVKAAKRKSNVETSKKDK